MSASQRVQILADKSKELDILAEFIKNPNLIEQLAYEVKKLNSLTAEEGKLAASKQDLKEYADKLLAMRSERDDLWQK